MTESVCLDALGHTLDNLHLDSAKVDLLSLRHGSNIESGKHFPKYRLHPPS